ncbi:TadA family conjugal transfer-associated ATPase [Curtobacterium sp. UCD-KPL2560]|uniref:TadA family conjugal transfer-associated ATPase n=1 Tax=Curtobacterium sp. UCD-KPL2560 TaxID=1885315 RepID=UPI0009F556A3
MHRHRADGPPDPAPRRRAATTRGAGRERDGPAGGGGTGIRRVDPVGGSDDRATAPVTAAATGRATADVAGRATAAVTGAVGRGAGPSPVVDRPPVPARSAVAVRSAVDCPARDPRAAVAGRTDDGGRPDGAAPERRGARRSRTAVHDPPFLPRVGSPTRRRAVDAAAFEELAAVVADAEVTDVLVVGDSGTWVDRGLGLERAGPILPERRVRALAAELVALGGRHVDETTPCADVRFGDGIRVHAVLAPVAVHGTALSVRLPRPERPTLAALERTGTFRLVGRTVLEDAVAARRNLVVTGATGSGKTTVLGALLAAVPSTERIVTVEDLAELRIDHPHVVALEARQSNAEGVGAIGLDRLVREALRMRPDRIVVGECRGAEVRELLSALNTGHDGGAGTLHANGLADVPARLEALGATAGWSPDALARQVVSALDLVVHVERHGRWRGVTALGAFALEDGRLVVRRVDR